MTPSSARPRWSVVLPAICLLTASPSLGADLPSLRLAAGGKASLPVIISGRASASTRQLAEELAAYLEKISGAPFEVQAGDGSRGIVLGTIGEFPVPELADGLAIRKGYDGKEAFAIRVDGNRLLLVGATELGASHAASRLLERLGCRWFFPSPEWEIVPHRASLTVTSEFDEVQRPALMARRIWYGYGPFDARCRKDYEAWARHNRMAQSLRCHCGHAWQSIILANQKTFDAHPEYLALVKGKRQGPQFCVSQPVVRAMARDYAVDHFRKHPEADMVSMETSDGGGHCECDACGRLSISDRAFGLANEVARELQRRCPGKWVGMLAYNDHCEPPGFDLEPNVYVQSTAGFIRGRYTFEELMALWPKRCRNLGFYEYLSVWLWDFDMPPGGRGSNLAYLRKRIPEYIALGATSLDCESGNNWGVHGLGYYVANRLMWDPRTDVDALVTDFLDRAFGPGAPAMRRYFQRLDAGGEPLVSQHLLALALRDLEEASRLASARPDVLARLAHIKQYQHFVRLRWEHDRTGDKDKRRELALDALRHVYRNRYSYMNHWAAMRSEWWPKVAEDLAEPEARQGAGPSSRPAGTGRPGLPRKRLAPDALWAAERPYSLADTDRLFREDLARFQPEAVDEKTFSADLRPVGTAGPKAAGINQVFQRPARYALWSRAGEKLELAITTGVIAWYRDRPEGRYTLTDPAGRPVAGGRLPQDGGVHPISLPVPGAGLYWFEFDDHAAGWRIQIPPERSAALALDPGKSPIHLGHMQAVYFFVPRGTRRIDYYWQGGPHDVYLPDGKKAGEIASSGKFVRVVVPDGMDGRPWSLRRLALGRLRFFNCPNYLGASPEGLLLPRELAP